MRSSFLKRRLRDTADGVSVSPGGGGVAVGEFNTSNQQLRLHKQLLKFSGQQVHEGFWTLLNFF